jgi:hypothetical protein
MFEWLVELSFLSAFSDAVGSLTDKERRSLVIATFWHVAALKRIISERIAVRLGSMDLAEAYGDISSEALQGKFLNADEIRDSVAFAPSNPVPQKVPQ